MSKQALFIYRIEALSLYLAFPVILFFFNIPLRCDKEGVQSVNTANNEKGLTTSHIYTSYAFQSAWFALLMTGKTLTMEVLSRARYFATRVADGSSLRYLYTVYFN